MTELDSEEPQAWVTTWGERRRLEDRLQQLVGRHIERVRYIEIEGVSGWTGPVFDSPTFGLEWDFEDGAAWGVTWDQSSFWMRWPSSFRSQTRARQACCCPAIPTQPGKSRWRGASHPLV